MICGDFMSKEIQIDPELKKSLETEFQFQNLKAIPNPYVNRDKSTSEPLVVAPLPNYHAN